MPSRPWRSGTHEAGPSVKTVAIENQAIKPGVGGRQASSGGSGADAVQRMESDPQAVEGRAGEVGSAGGAGAGGKSANSERNAQMHLGKRRRDRSRHVHRPPRPRVAARLEANRATPRPHTRGSHGVLLARR